MTKAQWKKKEGQFENITLWHYVTFIVGPDGKKRFFLTLPVDMALAKTLIMLGATNYQPVLFQMDQKMSRLAQQQRMAVCLEFENSSSYDSSYN